MSNVPKDLKYVDSHEWLRLEADGSVTVGITDYAQETLGDIVYIEVPDVGAEIETNGDAGVVESVKSVSDIFSPIAGTVVAVNTALSDTPDLVNSDAYGEGWFFKIKPSNPSDLDALMTAEEYEESIK